MSGPHPLNQAVITQLMYFQRNGQFRHIQSWGFSQKHLEKLKQPAAVSALVNARVPWCTVTVNGKVLDRLLHQACDFEKEVEAVDRVLKIGASTEMVSEFFGLTHQEVALRRQILDLPDRKGRWPVLSEAQDSALWERWKRAVQTQALNVADSSAMFRVGADLAEDMKLPFAVVWGSIRRWIDEGLV